MNVYEREKKLLYGDWEKYWDISRKKSDNTRLDFWFLIFDYNYSGLKCEKGDRR